MGLLVEGLFTYSAVRFASLVLAEWQSMSATKFSQYLLTFILRFCGIVILSTSLDLRSGNGFLAPARAFFRSRAFTSRHVYCFVAIIAAVQFASLVGFDAISLDDIFDGAVGVLCVLKIAEDSRKVAATHDSPSSSSQGRRLPARTGSCRPG